MKLWCKFVSTSEYIIYLTFLIAIKCKNLNSLKIIHTELRSCRSGTMIFLEKGKVVEFFFRSDSMCYLREIVHGKLNLGEIFSCCAACNVKALSWRGNNSRILTLPLGNASGLLWRKQVFKYKSINFFFHESNFVASKCYRITTYRIHQPPRFSQL